MTHTWPIYWGPKTFMLPWVLGSKGWGCVDVPGLYMMDGNQILTPIYIQLKVYNSNVFYDDVYIYFIFTYKQIYYTYIIYYIYTHRNAYVYTYKSCLPDLHSCQCLSISNLQTFQWYFFPPKIPPPDLAALQDTLMTLPAVPKVNHHPEAPQVAWRLEPETLAGVWYPVFGSSASGVRSEFVQLKERKTFAPFRSFCVKKTGLNLCWIFWIAKKRMV